VSDDSCQSCGAAEWRDGRCAYCGRLDRSIEFLFENPGVGLIGTWVDGVLVEGELFPQPQKKKNP
jgi:hypothetical protein